MGRSMLIFVVLMTTIFASVLTSVYRNIGGVPDVLIRNQLNKEIENLSDFILKRAVREAASENFLEDLQDMAGSGGGGVVVGDPSAGTSLSDMVFTRVYGAGEEVYSNCKVDSITYSFSSSNLHYKIQTFISGEMQGVRVARTAEMAFSFPILVEGKVSPNIVYLEFDQVLRLHWLKQIFRLLFPNISKNDFPDSTSNNYSGTFHGLTFSRPTGNHDNDDFSDWGDGNNKLFVKLNGANTYITIDPDPPNQPDTFMEMDTTEDFSLLCFAKIDKNGRNSSGLFGLSYSDRREHQGTLMWIPSDPKMYPNTSNTAAEYKRKLWEKPAAAIWFKTKSKTDAKGELYFQVTQRKLKDGEEPDANGNYSDSQYDFNLLSAVMEYERKAVVWNESGFSFFRTYSFNKNHINWKWHSFALTYKIEMVNGVRKGVLRGFLNGGSGMPDGKTVTVMGEPLELYPNRFGMTLGARDLRNSNDTFVSTSDENRKHFFGIMDQAGMSNYAMPEEEVEVWHDQVMKPTFMHYIRD